MSNHLIDDPFDVPCIGIKGLLAIAFIAILIALWCNAADAKQACEQRLCLDGTHAKILDGECVCVSDPPQVPRP